MHDLFSCPLSFKWSTLSCMNDENKVDPLHGVTLEMMLNRLVDRYGWEKMGTLVKIKCFTNDPS